MNYSHIVILVYLSTHKQKNSNYIEIVKLITYCELLQSSLNFPSFSPSFSADAEKWHCSLKVNKIYT